jgi:hypothetical protein
MAADLPDDRCPLDQAAGGIDAHAGGGDGQRVAQRVADVGVAGDDRVGVGATDGGGGDRRRADRRCMVDLRGGDADAVRRTGTSGIADDQFEAVVTGLVGDESRVDHAGVTEHGSAVGRAGGQRPLVAQRRAVEGARGAAVEGDVRGDFDCLVGAGVGAAVGGGALAEATRGVQGGDLSRSEGAVVERRLRRAGRQSRRRKSVGIAERDRVGAVEHREGAVEAGFLDAVDVQTIADAVPTQGDVLPGAGRPGLGDADQRRGRRHAYQQPAVATQHLNRHRGVEAAFDIAALGEQHLIGRTVADCRRRLEPEVDAEGAAEACRAATGDADQVVDAVEAEGLADQAGSEGRAVLGDAVVGGGAVERVVLAGPPADQADGRRRADGDSGDSDGERLGGGEAAGVLEP